jgi:putative solute:sodium symporter small subunit
MPDSEHCFRLDGNSVFGVPAIEVIAWKFPESVPIQAEVHSMSSDLKQAYWKANLRLLVGCLLIWFVVSFGFGILLVDALNSIRLGGFKLGFWFAQQGSIYVFLLLIFFYAWRMNKLDRDFDVHED